MNALASPFPSDLINNIQKVTKRHSLGCRYIKGDTVMVRASKESPWVTIISKVDSEAFKALLCSEVFPDVEIESTA